MPGGRFLPVTRAETEMGRGYRALITRTEERWVETGRGLTEEEARAMRRLAGKHANHNSRLLRQGDAPYGTGSDQPQPVTDACA